MQQLFNTRNYSVRDFEEWNDRSELVLAPKFQRRAIWSPKAQSYLIDTIIRGKPIPKLYMRQNVDPATRKTTREIVDGQQRLRTVLSFIKGEFRINKSHHEDYGGSLFSGLDPEVQKDILKYEFVVDLLQDMPDPEVHDVFARINTYSERLKPQELRNAKWFGDFKSCVYSLTTECVGFLERNKVFTAKQILRMAEAELISELLLAMQEGIREGKKSVIDSAYKRYDDIFPNRRRHEKRFRETMDVIGGVVGDELRELRRVRAARIFYPLFCSIYHSRLGLPRLHAPTPRFKVSDYPVLKKVLVDLDELIAKVQAGAKTQQEVQLSADQRRFYDAYAEHWVHAPNRVTLTAYLCRQFAKALK